MLTKDDLLECADLYRALTGVEEVTLSYRIFGDTKKLRALRDTAGITLDRFNAGMTWFATNWPEGANIPARLKPYHVPTPDAQDAA
jgi:hypothetical protein